MKKDYKRYGDELGRRAKGRYVHKYGGYYRLVRTTNELRQLKGDDADGIPVRRRRLTIPTAYDDPNVSRFWKRSWKDFTKNRKQWQK